MSRLRRLERDFVYADIAAVASLLEQLDADDVMARFGLELRLHELRLAAAQLDALPDETTASAALFFGGRPVLGSLGIESEFGGAALTKFQDLVAKMLAHESGSLGLRGVVPNKNASTLHVTNIVKGSFGFLLEEMQPQQTMLETPLKAAVDGATGLLDAFGKDDEEQFQTAVESIDDRVLGTARELFGLMQQNGATLRVVAGDIDRSFDSNAVARAAERAVSTNVVEEEREVRGELAGILPNARQFEFRSADGSGILRGTVSKQLKDDELSLLNRKLVNVDAIARLHVKRVLRNGITAREKFTLIEIKAMPGQEPLVAPAAQ